MLVAIAFTNGLAAVRLHSKRVTMAHFAELGAGTAATVNTGSGGGGGGRENNAGGSGASGKVIIRYTV